MTAESITAEDRKYYSKEEVERLAELLDFDIPPKCGAYPHEHPPGDFRPVEPLESWEEWEGNAPGNPQKGRHR